MAKSKKRGGKKKLTLKELIKETLREKFKRIMQENNNNKHLMKS